MKKKHFYHISIVSNEFIRNLYYFARKHLIFITLRYKFFSLDKIHGLIFNYTNCMLQQNQDFLNNIYYFTENLVLRNLNFV